METKGIIFRELIKRGYSLVGNNGEKRIWDLSDSKLPYLTTELSKGFIDLGKYYEPYRVKVLDTENEMLKKHMDDFSNIISSKKFNLIDLGCGDGLKAETFIKNLPEDVTIRYCPVDISEHFIDEATKRIKKIGNVKVSEIRKFISDFDSLDKVVESLKSEEGYEKNVVLFLGETVSHYEVNGLLYDISEKLSEGDIMLIGNGYKVSDRFIEVDKYKDPLFNKWFVHIMESLGFSNDEIEYNARFNNGRLEFYYEILVDKSIESGGKNIRFRKGDEVIIICQYKYYQEEWKEFFDLYFKEVKNFNDEKKEYAIYVCEK